MEKPKSSFSKQEKKKAVIRLGKASGGGGGGVGVGIIFLGGAVVSATAAFLIRRRLRKSSSTSNSKNCNHDRSTPASEIPYKFLEDRNNIQSKGLQFVARDSSPYADTDQNLSNGTAKIEVRENDNTTISDQSFSLDQKYKVEANEGKGYPISDGEEIIHSNSPKGWVSSMQFDASPIKEEKSALPFVENQTLRQLKNVADHLSGEEIEMIKEDNSIDTALVNQTEEENQQMLENIEGEETQINCCPDEDNMKEMHCQEASETTDAEQRIITKLQFGEEQESPFHCGKESYLSKDERQETEESSLAFKTVQVIEKDDALDVTDAEQDNGDTDTMTQMTEVGSLCSESFGVINRNEKLEASREDLGKGNTSIVMLAEEETKCDHHDISLNIGANEETKGNETFKTTDEDVREDTVALMSEEGQRKCLVGWLTTETADVMGEVEMLEEDEGSENEFVLVEEEKGAQHDKEISGEWSQANGEKAQFSDNIASGSNQQKIQTEEPETSLNVDHEDMSVCCDELISENSSSKNCNATVTNMLLTGVNIPAQLKPKIGIDNGFMEVQLSAEEENVNSEPTTEDRSVDSENPPMQLVERQHLNGHNEYQPEEVEDTFQVIYAANVTIEEHNLMRPEEDNLDDEEDDDADEANIIERVEKSSEATGDSSLESNSMPIWPAESLEKVSMEPKELKFNEQKGQMEEDQTVKTQVPMYLQNIGKDGIMENSIQKGNDSKGNSKLTFVERVMLELAKHTHQPTNSQKLRVIIPTLLVLSWSLCFWRFGLPILKISLIVILIKILSKIQGY